MDKTWPDDAVAGEFSRLAYVRFERDGAYRTVVADAVGALGYRDVGFFSDGSRNGAHGLDGQGFAGLRADGHAIIAFRGTQPDSLRDVLSDVRALPVSWTGAGRVHRGFNDALLGLLPQVDRWIADRRIVQLTVTGHSLGAAMATLFAARHRDADLVTFGSPRVGDAAFATAWEGRTMRRYVDCTDLVAHLPPKAIGYRHLDGLRYIDATGHVHLGDALGPVMLCRDQIRARRAFRRVVSWNTAPFRGLADHAPINYISAILGCRIGP
ncbi:lipase family protein [Sphingomonas sp. 4RDLI-65]|uniref:lipase family protein n=1 Tax=Sphingomonas sp. 4RDLI-65 TaxID=3111641 RepID=UPI003C25F54B